MEGGAPSRSVRAQAVLLAGFCWLGFVAPKEVHLPPKKVGTVIVNGTVHLCVYTVCINTVYLGFIGICEHVWVPIITAEYMSINLFLIRQHQSPRDSSLTAERIFLLESHNL